MNAGHVFRMKEQFATGLDIQWRYQKLFLRFSDGAGFGCFTSLEMTSGTVNFAGTKSPLLAYQKHLVLLNNEQQCCSQVWLPGAPINICYFHSSRSAIYSAQLSPQQGMNRGPQLKRLVVNLDAFKRHESFRLTLAGHIKHTGTGNLSWLET